MVSWLWFFLSLSFCLFEAGSHCVAKRAFQGSTSSGELWNVDRWQIKAGFSCVCAYTCASGYMSRPEVNVRCPSQLLSPLVILWQGLPLDLELLTWLYWWASKPQRFSRLCPQRWGYRCLVLIFTWALRSELRPPCSSNQQFTSWQIPSP